MFPDHNLYQASEIHSHPEVKARPARKADPAKGRNKDQPARRAHPARRGILKIGKTQFYRNLEAERFPESDAEQNGRRCWTGRLLNKTLYRNQ